MAFPGGVVLWFFAWFCGFWRGRGRKCGKKAVRPRGGKERKSKRKRRGKRAARPRGGENAEKGRFGRAGVKREKTKGKEGAKGQFGRAGGKCGKRAVRPRGGSKQGKGKSATKTQKKAKRGEKARAGIRLRRYRFYSCCRKGEGLRVCSYSSAWPVLFILLQRRRIARL